MKQLTKNVFIETGWSGANVGCVVTSEGLVMIDTPHNPSDAMKWKQQVESKGVVKYLINTESHEDHYFCDFFFKVPVITHEKAREVILKSNVKQMTGVVAFKDPEGVSLVKDYKPNVPVITFSQNLTFYLGKHTFQLIHFGGHSPSLISILIPEERVVFTGDNVHNKIQAFTHEADPYAWLEAIDKISMMDIDYIVPGHGEAGDKSILKPEKEFIQESIVKIKNALKQGWTKEETIARVSFERDPMDYGMGDYGKVLLDMSVAQMYDFLSKKK
jgi:cyclase